MGRPYLKANIEELEHIVRTHKHSLAVLGQVREELTYRQTDRAKSLLRDVMGLLTGKVERPRQPPPADSTENQINLLDGEDPVGV